METWLYGLVGASSVLGVALFLGFIFFLLVFIRRIARSGRVSLCRSPKAEGPWPSKGNGRDRCKVFTFQEMAKYSEGFSNRIGDGTSNVVYKGNLPDGTEVAIKRTKEGVTHSSDVESKFCFQVELLSRVHHQQLVNLVGFCRDKTHQMLVFQYASNGTLYENLHGVQLGIPLPIVQFREMKICRGSRG